MEPHTALAQLQYFFRQLSVFRGGFTCEAAAAVTQEPTAAHYLQQLQSASLLVAEENNDGCRFRLLETVREYALELLVQSGEESAVCRRHAEYFLQSAQTAYAHLLGGKEQNAWMQRLEVEADNLRAALAWLLKNDASSGLCMAVATARYWRVAGRDTELSDLLKRALKHSAKAPATIRVVVLREMGEVLLRLGGQCPDNYRRATRFLVQSAQLCRELSDEQNLA
jgi:predicted ATPase